MAASVTGTDFFGDQWFVTRMFRIILLLESVCDMRLSMHQNIRDTPPKVRRIPSKIIRLYVCAPIRESKLRLVFKQVLGPRRSSRRHMLIWITRDDNWKQLSY
jgi:hypothetical protein